MNERNINLESTLQRLKLAGPSENYFSRGVTIIRQNRNNHSFWNARIGIALSAALLLSIGINLLQLSNMENSPVEKSIVERSSESLEPSLVASTQATANNELQTSDISNTASVFRFLCLTKSSVVVNNSLNLGELKGFGEWVFFQTPDNYQVTVSLQPLRQWTAIGQFEDGNISLQLDAGEVMELRGVGIGPSSLKRGGPFPVYGNIQKLDTNNVSSRSAAQNVLSLDSRAQLAPATPSGTSSQETVGITNIVAGVDTELSPLTQKYFGALLRSGECG
ncbi:MAG: hypothetical protein COB20_10825 [SAR86 cluster bacterium]|uniref:Uncharacterized protein n=1 Tax=SAR86 cluster bacterium TaxID=2030880 RepID=A0A2A4X1I2_9GAMM|nr:MAG: hypothetical protein COB20_10825 [SAR86 cluster bacterium]